MKVVVPDDLVESAETKIVLVVIDGLGGLPDPETGATELETARTPNLDRIARNSDLGLLLPISRGVTPGSGPGHLALFGYDPIEWSIGRGVLSALGIGFDLREGDIAVRLNFATLDTEGRVTDRRAGRPDDEENARLIAKLRAGVSSPAPGVDIFFEGEKEHRAVLIIRGENLSADLSDTDPQEFGVPPLHVRPLADGAEESARLVQQILTEAEKVLADEPKANTLLARGFAAYERYPSMTDRYKLRSRAIARYPMYGGVARLLGMDVVPIPETDADSVKVLAEGFDEYDFHFVHFKAVDSRGEDGDFAAKVEAIEEVDALIPEIEELEPDVLIVTGDHSTPSRYRAHSWHTVPLLIASEWTRYSREASFGETSCRMGELGIFPAVELMTLALAHAGRLAKYGA